MKKSLPYSQNIIHNRARENVPKQSRLCAHTHRPLREEQYGTTWIPKGLSSPRISTVLVRLRRHAGHRNDSTGKENDREKYE